MYPQVNLKKNRLWLQIIDASGIRKSKGISLWIGIGRIGSVALVTCDSKIILLLQRPLLSLQSPLNPVFQNNVSVGNRIR